MAVTTNAGSEAKSNRAQEDTAHQVVTAPKAVPKDGEDAKIAKTAIDEMQAYLDSRPKVSIRVPEDEGDQWVQINGHVTIIKAGVRVQVADDIATMLEEAGVI